MAFDQTTRNRLARFVSDARALLTEEFTRQLQNEYGLDPASGEVTPIDRLTALDDRQRETARILRETLEYYLAGNSNLDSKAYRDVLDRIVREQAFTVLNRLCALRMSEARGLVLESIAKGYQSKGFQLYARLAGSALGETGETYRMYLFSLMDEFAVDLPVLFDRFSPQGRLFPREAALLKLLELINEVEIESLWSEDETIGWIYQYFNSKEERKAMRDASQAPRNSRELAVRNQFFTPRYVVEFLTDNTLGRIWYEMTRDETILKDSCRYLVRRKHSFFLEEGQEAPEPFLPAQQHETDPDLAHEMWLPPNDQITDLYTIFLYGLTTGGYDYAREQWGIECGDLANEKLKQYHETRKWEGTFDELRCCLFFEQRRYHHFGEGPEGDDAKAILDLYQAICERWNLEVEYIPHRPLKDPREIKMLDPACGSMHFGLYAFDLFEQIYAEAWDLEDRLGEDALQRLADLEPLHKTYPDKQTYLKDVPRLIIERNIHGVDIDSRAVQIAGLSLWLRAQKSWQSQGLRPSERPQIRKSNVVCAEPMPGDQQMLEEFLSTLRGERLEVLMRKAWHVPADQKMRATPQMADALAKLVRTVWHEMELAGEAGSLLKIEETLREAIATARKESEEKSPLFRVLEYGLDLTLKEHYVQLVAGEDQDFFDRAEVLVLAALSVYAEQAENGIGYQRRLFAGDAIQGFDFINLCRKQYDVVLMNPPFGESSIESKGYLSSSFPNTKNDIYAAFVERGILLNSKGYVGAITSRTGFFQSSFEKWRTEVILKLAPPSVFADLGGEVLDGAMVETAMYVLSKSVINRSIYFRLGYINDKSHELFCLLKDLQQSTQPNNTFIVNSIDFNVIPRSPFTYWIPESIRILFRELPTFESEKRSVKQGLATADDYRFLRAFWEISPEHIGKKETDHLEGAYWYPYPKGGEFSPFYADIPLVVNWHNSGSEYWHNLSKSGGVRSNIWMLNETVKKFFFHAGLTYPRRLHRLAVMPMPEGSIISVRGSGIYAPQNELFQIMGLFSSAAFDFLVKCMLGRFGFPQFDNGTLSITPIPESFPSDVYSFEKPTKEANEIKRKLDMNNETSHLFVKPFLSPNEKSFKEMVKNVQSSISQKKDRLLELQNEIDGIAFNLYGFSKSDRELILQIINTSIAEKVEDGENFEEKMVEINSLLPNELDIVTDAISYVFGCVFGRWDIRYVINRKIATELSNPFTSQPACPLGMLQNAMGLPVISQDEIVDYPLRISWPGILVDDEGYRDDIEGRVRDALHKIWGERVEAIEVEACQILGVRTVREYFRKPALFFADHLKRYSKSRRAAPIYWPLSTPSCSYTLWLYYHRLNDQMLYTCVNDFVDPKLKQVSEEAASLRLKKGRSAADEKELERLTDFERELRDFREELLRVAMFWKPNLNDGVEITGAPLWKLFQHKPWQKRLKETWQKLEAGEYDWAHLAYSIWPERVRQKCKSDKSLAIAHDLESLYVEPPVSAKKKKAKKQTSDEESEGWFNED